MTKRKTVQYSVPVRNEPESIHRLAEALAEADVNIASVMTDSMGEIACMRFLADKEGNSVRRPLEKAGFTIFENICFQFQLPDQPGELSRLMKRLADENVRILNLYGETNGAENALMTIVVDQPEKAQPILDKVAQDAVAA